MKYLLSILCLFTIIQTQNIPAYKYLYFTHYERAGGGPYVFDGYPAVNNRRLVNFGSGDAFNSQWPQGEPICECSMQTNGQFTMSNFGCPTFSTTVTVTIDENGEFNSPDMGACNENQVFQGDPPQDTLATINTAVIDYDYIYENATHIFDATQKMNFSPIYIARDTLIMTDIEFFPEDGGGIKVKQWWYLMPPYLSTNIEMPSIDGSAMNCDPGTPLYDCDEYIESMENFHAKTVTDNGYDTFLDPIVQGTYGFHHYDIKDIYASSNNWVSQLNDSHLLPEYQLNGYQIYNYEGPTTIYVKGGPVRVHGKYLGEYTIYTDEYTAYHRHAWGTNLEASSGGGRIDTLWNNIWITDDIVNNDASWNGSLINAQPNAECNNGSENILGLVSGANVYVANTQANGARNNMWNQDVKINAHIIALNESFATQYWQNTISNPAYCSDPPYGDGQGEDIYNGGTGGNDYRGTIYLWGGVVQKFRGYTVRNGPGPYNTGDIGFHKDYNYDCNLSCNPPPNYPIFSTFAGDMNQDSIINILDVISIVLIILDDLEYNNIADLNYDYSIDVLDVIALVNVIVGEE